MSEFRFKNLSVRLFPAEAQAAREECTCCSYVVGCGPCTNTVTVDCGPCTNTVTVDCGPCTNTISVVCGPCSNAVSFNCGICSNVTCGRCTNTATIDPGCFCSVLGAEPTKVMAPFPVRRFAGRAGDVRAELAALKTHLQQALADVEANERQMESAARPRTVEEIDQLRAQLMDAVAELDEQRAQLEKDTPRPE